jgi:hypothetical protein
MKPMDYFSYNPLRSFGSILHDKSMETYYKRKGGYASKNAEGYLTLELTEVKNEEQQPHEPVIIEGIEFLEQDLALCVQIRHHGH